MVIISHEVRGHKGEATEESGYAEESACLGRASMIRVLLVDDSPLVLNLLQRLLVEEPTIQVVGTACNGKQGLALIPLLQPDVICTDLHMPVMNGLDFTREVVSHCPRPILVISVSVEENSPNVFKLLEAGAVDVFPKPRMILETDFFKVAADLAARIRIVAGVHVFRRSGDTKSIPMVQAHLNMPTRTALRVLVIGASTGGPQALREILMNLPTDFPLPIVCVQHISHHFLSGMLAWLADECALPVATAVSGEIPKAGKVYFAPEDMHLGFDANGRFLLSMEPPVDGHRPSVSVTLKAAADCFGRGAVGLLLTGMGRDGAYGMAAIAAAGGVTFAQDEASCVVYGMPKEAVLLGAVQHLLPLEQIAPALRALLNSGTVVCGVSDKGGGAYGK